MKISELVAILEKVKEKHGDIEVVKDGRPEFGDIQASAYFDLEKGDFAEALLRI